MPLMYSTNGDPHGEAELLRFTAWIMVIRPVYCICFLFCFFPKASWGQSSIEPIMTVLRWVKIETK